MSCATCGRPVRENDLPDQDTGYAFCSYRCSNLRHRQGWAPHPKAEHVDVARQTWASGGVE